MKVQDIALQVIKTNDLFKLTHTKKEMVLTIGINPICILANVRGLKDLTQFMANTPNESVANGILNANVDDFEELNTFGYRANDKALMETLYLNLEIIDLD